MPKAECSPSDDAGIPSLNEKSPLAQALAGGEPQRVGWFRLYFDDERWEWSPEVERMHGYEPGTVQPTTALVLSHKHPEDYEQVAATLDEIRRTREPFSTRHRIIDVQGRTREVVVVAGHLRTTPERRSALTASTSTSLVLPKNTKQRLPKRSPKSPNTGPPSNRPKAF
jgi:hypothetical protein